MSWTRLWMPYGRLEQSVVAGKAYRTDRERYGMLGWVRTVEVTYNPAAKSHHPHIHAAIVTERVLTDVELKALEGRIFGRWSRGLVRAGLSAPTRRRGIVLKRVTGGRCDTQELAEYLSKYDDAPYDPELEQGTDDGERWISDETVRGDRKLGRGGSEGRRELRVVPEAEPGAVAVEPGGVGDERSSELFSAVDGDGGPVAPAATTDSEVEEPE